MVFAGCWSPRISLACSTKEFAILALFLASGDPSVGSTGSGSRPVRWGSESVRTSESPSPLKTATALYSFSGMTKTSTPSRFSFSLSSAISSSPFSEEMRPALRSEILPDSSLVAKFTRAARSLSPRSKPTPSAESTPRPTWKRTGSYPKRARWPGPLPGLTPAATGSESPRSDRAAKASKLGASAASNSVGPEGSIGRPPRPSRMRSKIFDSVLTDSSRMRSRSKTLLLIRGPGSLPDGFSRYSPSTREPRTTPVPLRSSSATLDGCRTTPLKDARGTDEDRDRRFELPGGRGDHRLLLAPRRGLRGDRGDRPDDLPGFSNGRTQRARGRLRGRRPSLSHAYTPGPRRGVGSPCRAAPERDLLRARGRPPPPGGPLEVVEERHPHLRGEDGRALGRDAPRPGRPPRGALRRRGARGGGRRPRGALHAGARLPPPGVPRAGLGCAPRRRRRRHSAAGPVLRPPADAAPRDRPRGLGAEHRGDAPDSAAEPLPHALRALRGRGAPPRRARAAPAELGSPRRGADGARGGTRCDRRRAQAGRRRLDASRGCDARGVGTLRSGRRLHQPGRRPHEVRRQAAPGSR